jgi:hypothetical protein
MNISTIPRLFLAGLILVCTASAYGAAPVVLQISRGGTTSLPAASAGVDAGFQSNELDVTVDVEGVDIRGAGGRFSGGTAINRSIAKGEGKAAHTKGSGKAKSHPELIAGFDGLTLRDQRLANGGKQFTVEPPDQALCAGNGFVLESVNDVLQVFDGAGVKLTGVIDLNTFYQYPAAIDRSANKFGPSITDPVCLFDRDTQRWFHVVLTLDRVGTTSVLSGTNHLDIAVSTTSSPLDPWTIYRLPVQNDGTAGTPNHHCAGAPLVPPKKPTFGPCLGDYPHIGADGNAIYLTTNEFSLFGSGFTGAQIYTLSKKALVNAALHVPTVLINTGEPDVPFPGFTIWPAQALNARSSGGSNTEFLLSSLAVFSDDNSSNQILLWSISNTKSIDAPVPNLKLHIQPITTDTYSVPPQSTQKAGDTPLRDCIANASGDKCNLILGVETPIKNPISPIDSSDSRMQQVFYANGKLWGALGTSVQIDNDPKPRAGIAYFVIDPHAGKLVKQGKVALAGNNAIYPSIAVTNSGRGVLGFTLVGDDHFPSAAYTSLDAVIGAGPVVVVKEGAGPQDGFTGYLPFSDRPRWGDYGAAATDGTSIWIASEYIAQTCTSAIYKDPANFGSCGGTRVALGNWATRISRFMP